MKPIRLDAQQRQDLQRRRHQTPDKAAIPAEYREVA